MKKVILILFVLLFYCPSQASIPQPKDPQQIHLLDSVMQLMRDKSIPLIERYYMTGNIEHLVNEHKIEILKVLIPESNDYEDKAVVTRLYSLISLFNTQLSHFQEAKSYLDSAFLYINQIENPNISGLAHYSAGTYYLERFDASDAHRHYYQAAEFFNRNDPKPGILNDIYYNLSAIYMLTYNEKGLKVLFDWMSNTNIDFPAQEMLQQTVSVRYYLALYHKKLDYSYLDSILICNQKAFDIYETTENPFDVGFQIAENYSLQATALFHLQQYDQAEKYLKKATELINPDYIFGWLQVQFLSAQLLFCKEDYVQSEITLKESLLQLSELAKTQDIYYYSLLSEHLSLLSQVFEKQGKISDALEAEREGLKYEQLFFETTNSDYIQDLRAKYDLDNKQRSLDQLIEINRMHQRSKVLYIGLGILLLVILILVIFLYRRRQKTTQIKLREEKLTSQLEREKAETLTAKIEENEQKYQRALANSKLRQVNSYLQGLEAERTRLSKELHDNVANSLLSINLQLETNKNVNLADIMQKLRTTQEHVREISHDLIPPAFQYATFSEILKDYIYQQNQQNQTQATLLIESESTTNKIPGKMSLEMYRIIQESISNVLKHAHATRIEILIYLKNGHIHLTIIDNGKGFDTKANHSGIGLLIIRERVKSMTGSLQINSSFEKGTEIHIEIPL